MSAQTTASMSDTAKAAAREVKDKITEPSAEDLRQELDRLREDMARIAGTLADLGRHRGEAVADSLRDNASRLYAAGEQRAEDLARRATDAYAECNDMVRRQPATAMGIAAGLGFLAGLLLARK